MTCSLCPKTALYIAGKRYFCGTHKAEAVVRSTAIGREAQSCKAAESYYSEMRGLRQASGTRARF